MNNFNIQLILTLLMPLLLCLLATPLVIRLSLRLRLVDVPNERKTHTAPIPRLGGLVIFASAIAGIALSTAGWQAVHTWPVFFSCLAVLFITGVWDDLREISARMKLAIQLCCGIAIAATGVRLTSLYGILGIGELDTAWQYIITVTIIVGVTNAFNLIDGVDGLAGGLAVISMAVLGWLAFRLQLYSLLIVLVAFTGAVLGFLKNNASPARIFMGDGGSLVLGCLMSVAGVIMIGKAHANPTLIRPAQVAILIVAILIIPVFDAVRVFAHRIRRGLSPFKADRTHIHHLCLVAGLDHRRTARFLYSFELLLIAMSILLSGTAQLSVIIGFMVLFFHCTTEVLRVNQGMEKWRAIIMKMEKEE